MPNAHTISYRLALSVCAVVLVADLVVAVQHPGDLTAALGVLIPVVAAVLVTALQELLANQAQESTRRVALLDAQIAVHEGQVEMNHELLARLKAGEGRVTISGEGTLQ